VFSLFSICYKTQAKACGYQNWSFAIGSIFYVFIVRLSFGLLLSLQFICLSYWTDSYILTEEKIEESNKVKLFEHFIEDLKRLLKDED